MKFGVFDHVDFTGDSIEELFKDRLRMAEIYERCGLHGYHIAEHHSTPLGYAPSPSVLISAAFQRTQRLRIGPLVYLLPLYHPLRLLEEVCMLDHLSSGRLMLGVGRGASPIEVGFYEVPSAEQQARYEETLEILLKGLQSEKLTFDGRYHKFFNVPMVMRPYQRPYPELWYGARSEQATIWAARNGVNVVTLALDDDVRRMTDLYRREWTARGGSIEALPLMGVSRHIVVADTDAEAKRIASGAYRRWRESFAKLWIDKELTVPLSNLYPTTWEEVEAIKNGCAGSPETVRRFAQNEVRRGGINYFVSWFAFGNLGLNQVARSVELFSRHVMPTITEPVPVE